MTDPTTRAYPRRESVAAGETLTLHVSTALSRFRVEVYRQGVALERMSLELDAFHGHEVGDGPPDEDFGWPGYPIPVPTGWPSGAYVAHVVDADAPTPALTTADGPDSRALFIVRNPVPGDRGRTLYKLATNTYQAYNGTGGGSLYAQPHWRASSGATGFKVTLRRPGGGTGGTPMPGNFPDEHDPDVPRNTFGKWDVPFIAWLEGSGRTVDYCTDLDLHEDPALLDPYALLLCVGHDEYWSDAMRGSVDAFLARGGNAAFFSGDNVSWRVHYTDDGTALSCAKVKPGTRDGGAWDWDDYLEVDPQARLTGVDWTKGVHWWDGRRPPLGYTVQHAAHWVWEGTGLADGDVLGADGEPPIIGYESEGTPFGWRNGIAVPVPWSPVPKDLFLLGVAQPAPGAGWFADEGAAATMGMYTAAGGGTVFQAATTDWALSLGQSEVAARVTGNVLDRLGLPALRLVGPLPFRGARAVTVVGQVAKFHVDTVGLPPSTELRWAASSGRLEASGPAAEVAVGGVEPLTVQVTALRDGEPVGFASRTLLPLSALEARQLEVCVLLREMTMPSEPSFPLVTPTSDPVEQMAGVSKLHAEMIARHADRLVRVSRELLEHFADQGG